MELTNEEKQIVVNLLSQISVPIKEAPIVLRIIQKLQTPPVTAKEEKAKEVRPSN